MFLGLAPTPALGQTPRKFAGFEPAVFSPVGLDPMAVAVGDLNNDGFQDLVTANSFSDSVSILLGVGDGTFLPQIVVSVDLTGFTDAPRGIALGDLNGDGNLDAAVALAGVNVVTILLGAGDGTLTILGNFPAGGQPISIALGDLDGDGDLDVATANQLGANASVLLNNGDGTLAPQMVVPAGNFPQSVALGDLDGDGDLDMAVANGFSDDVSILFNAGNGTFTQGGSLTALNGGRFVTMGDLDGDNDLDLAVALAGEFVTVKINNGDGTFISGGLFGGLGGSIAVQIGDVNADGTPDLIATDWLNSEVVVFLGLGNATFGNTRIFPVSVHPWTVSTGLLNSDAQLDVVTPHGSTDDVAILLNLTVTGSPADLNGDGVVNSADLANLLGNWGGAGSADLDGNGVVNAADLASLLGAWGPVALSVQFTPNLSSQNVASEPSKLVGDKSARDDWLASLPLKATLPVMLDIPVRDRVTVDLNGDESLDQVLLVMGPDYARGMPSPCVLVYVSDGQGGFAMAQRFDSSFLTDPSGIAVRDLNGDSALDLLIADRGGQALAVMLGNRVSGHFDGVPLFVATSGAETVQECLDFLNDLAPEQSVWRRTDEVQE